MLWGLRVYDRFTIINPRKNTALDNLNTSARIYISFAYIISPNVYINIERKNWHSIRPLGDNDLKSLPILLSLLSIQKQSYLYSFFMNAKTKSRSPRLSPIIIPDSDTTIKELAITSTKRKKP